MATLNDLAPVLSQIATYCPPADIEAARSVSRDAHDLIRKSYVEQAELTMLEKGRAMQAEMDATSRGRKEGAKLNDELTENSVFRILWMASQSNCQYWNKMSTKEQEKYQKFFGFGKNSPDYLYFGVPADAFSVKSSLYEDRYPRPPETVTTNLLSTLVVGIEKKWKTYGDWTIAVADIST